MNILQSVLRPPVFENQEKTRAASLLNSLLLASLFAAILFVVIIVWLVPEDWERFYLPLPLFPLYITLKASIGGMSA